MSWICLPMGMYMPALRPAHTVPEGDDRLLQIRSRRKIDLERLRNELLPELGPTVRIPHTDYEYRAYCTHQQWAEAMYLAAMRIDYIKFKEQSEKVYGDVQLHNCYTRMWGTVFTALSTKAHQADYWSTQDRLSGRKSKGKGKNRQAGQSRWSPEATSSTGKHWWEDAEDPGPRTRRSDTPLLRDLIDDQFPGLTKLGITPDDVERIGYSGDDEIDKVIADWDETQPGNEIPITRRPNGTIDHSHCTHENTKNARRRCRKAANRNR